MSGFEELKIWFELENCWYVVMESMGVYWQFVYNIFENVLDGIMVVIVVNVRYMKNVSGKKIDMKDV